MSTSASRGRKRVVFSAKKLGSEFKSRNVGEAQTIEVLYWLVCSAISQFTIFHPCPISGWWLQWILYPPDHRTPADWVWMKHFGLTVERCQDVVMVHIAKSCRLQNRIFSIYPNLSGIALMFLFLNVFCPNKYPFCWRDLIAGISTFAAP